MKKYVIGNWKSNKNRKAAQAWFSEFSKLYTPVDDRSWICGLYGAKGNYC